MKVISEFLKMEKIGHRFMIQYLYLKGLSPTNIKAKLDPTLGEFAPTYILCNIGMRPYDLPRRATQWSTKMNKIHKAVLNDLRLKVRDVADIVENCVQDGCRFHFTLAQK